MYNKNLLKLASDLQKLNKAFSSEKCRIIDQKVYNSKFLFFHYFFWSSSFFDSPYRNILIDYFDKSEKRFPGSSYFLSVKLCNKIYGNYIDTPKTIKTEKQFDVIMKYLSTLTDGVSFNLFEKTMEFSGADATITCDKTKNKSIEVSKVCSPKFNISIDSSFKDIYFKTIKKTTKDFIVSIIDGFIERESELYSLIEHAKQQKLPVILICRGMSDFAKSNLKQIILKNKVYIYPYIEMYNNDDPFKLKDFSTLINTKMISSEFFDTINTNTVSKSKVIRCTLSSSTITVYNENELLIKEINKQIEDNKNNISLIEYLRKRKRRIAPNNTIVKIPESNITLLNEIKNLIKCYNFCAIQGVFKRDNNFQSIQCEKITNILSKNLYNTINNLSFKVKIGEKQNGTKSKVKK